jgi:hypothetical protein
MEGALRACETKKEAVYAADGTLALGGRPWVLNYIRHRRTRQFLSKCSESALQLLVSSESEPNIVGVGEFRLVQRLAVLFCCSQCREFSNRICWVMIFE